ncbi:MAG: OsmC family protein [Chloroflexi bacterium]|nr:OsmC family protein [Chloroflexota bacterium]
MAINAKVTLGEGLTTTIQIRDFTLTADEPLTDGGANLGPMPTELMLAALGACSAITAKLYAQRKGWDVQSIEVDLDSDRHKKADFPQYTGDGDFVRSFTQRLRFIGDLTDEQRARLLEIAGKCPVHRAFTEPKYMVEELVDAIIAEETPGQ